MKEIFNKEINGLDKKSVIEIEVMPNCTVDIISDMEHSCCANVVNFDADGLNNLISILTEAKKHLMEMSK